MTTPDTITATGYDTEIPNNFESAYTDRVKLRNSLLAVEQVKITSNIASFVQHIPNLIPNGHMQLIDRKEFTGVTTRAGYTSNYRPTEFLGWMATTDVVVSHYDNSGIAEMRISDAASGTSVGHIVYQRLDIFNHVRALQDKTITFVVEYTATNANVFRLKVDDGVAVTYSSTYNDAGTNKQITVNVTLSSNATKLTFGLEIVPGFGGVIDLIRAGGRFGTTVPNFDNHNWGQIVADRALLKALYCGGFHYKMGYTYVSTPFAYASVYHGMSGLKNLSGTDGETLAHYSTTTTAGQVTGAILQTNTVAGTVTGLVIVIERTGTPSILVSGAYEIEAIPFP